MKELNEQDRQRIEQKAWDEYIYFKEDFIKGAEYEHNYQRERQEQVLRDAYDAGLMCERILAKDEIERLKTERAELISLLREYVNDTGAVHTNHKARAEQFLNSLKTQQP